VKHSQSSSLPPLKVWLLAEKDGNIVCGHCSCMAGLGETCSHLGALVFLIEYSFKKINGVACTEELSKWLPPSLRSVPFNRIQEMDIRSSESRLRAVLSGKFNYICFCASTIFTFGSNFTMSLFSRSRPNN